MKRETLFLFFFGAAFFGWLVSRKAGVDGSARWTNQRARQGRSTRDPIAFSEILVLINSMTATRGPLGVHWPPVERHCFVVHVVLQVFFCYHGAPGPRTWGSTRGSTAPSHRGALSK